MQIATWNVNSLAVRLPQVLDWLAANPGVEVLGLQETKLSDDKFPAQAFADAGWQVQFFGQKTYNGVALISRQPMRDAVRNIPGMDCDMARVIAATMDVPMVDASTVQPLRVVCAYFPNGQAPGSDKFAYKMRWLDGLQQYVAQELAAHPRLALLGDFNITYDDRDTYDPIALAETIHHTSEERAHLQALLDVGLVDAFRCFEQADRSFSWWDYRDLAFRRKRGLRIDYVLASTALRAHLQACHIDVEPRKLERPSDHAPVVAEFAL